MFQRLAVRFTRRTDFAFDRRRLGGWLEGLRLEEVNTSEAITFKHH
jgi:hypothetical protein